MGRILLYVLFKNYYLYKILILTKQMGNLMYFNKYLGCVQLKCLQKKKIEKNKNLIFSQRSTKNMHLAKKLLDHYYPEQKNEIYTIGKSRKSSIQPIRAHLSSILTNQIKGGPTLPQKNFFKNDLGRPTLPHVSQNLAHICPKSAIFLAKWLSWGNNGPQ